MQLKRSNRKSTRVASPCGGNGTFEIFPFLLEHPELTKYQMSQPAAVPADSTVVAKDQ
jgi:hypothetical protein